MFDRKCGNKLGIIDIQYQYTMVAAALAAGGSMTDLEPGKELLLDLRKAGARIYPTNEAFAQALKTEEIDSASCGRRASVQWQNAGINVQTVARQGRRADVRLGLRDAEERAQQGRRLCLSRRHAGAVGAGEFRDRHGLQPDRHQRRGAARTSKAHRLHARGAEAPEGSRLRLHAENDWRSRTGGTRSSRAEDGRNGRHAHWRAAPSHEVDGGASAGPRRRCSGRPRSSSWSACSARSPSCCATASTLRSGDEADDRGGDARQLRQVLHRPVLHHDPRDHGAGRRAVHRGLPGAGLPAGLCRSRARRAATRTS